MPVLHAIVYGLVQGLGEFLPISSSAHLVALPWAAKWPDPGQAFDVALHLGTLVALVAYFWRDLGAFAAALVKNAPGDPTRRLAWLVLLASIPGGIFGVLLEKIAEERLRALPLVAGAMLVLGIVLYLADRYAPRRRTLGEVSVRDALYIGVAQAAALCPGVSRSGSTITAARALGLDREASARFSFLLAIPIVAGAGLLKMPKLVRAGGVNTELIVAMTVAAVSGYLAIGVLLRFVRTRSYLPFVVYRVAFALAVLGVVWSGLRPTSADEAPATQATIAVPGR